MKRFVSGKITNIEKVISKQSENDLGLSESYVKTMITLDNNETYESDELSSTIKEGQEIGLYLKRKKNIVETIVNQKNLNILHKRSVSNNILYSISMLVMAMVGVFIFSFPIIIYLNSKSFDVASFIFICISFMFPYLVHHLENERKNFVVKKEDKKDMEEYLEKHEIKDEDIKIKKETQLSEVI